jgi:hypothetical protein
MLTSPTEVMDDVSIFFSLVSLSYSHQSDRIRDVTTKDTAHQNIQETEMILMTILSQTPKLVLRDADI